MINFSQLRTKRLSVRLQELSIMHAIALCMVPEDRHEAATTEFLEKVIASAETPTAQHVADPRLWTVQERMMVVCHYLAHVSEEGANFDVGASGSFLDYVTPGVDIGTFPVAIGAVGGDEWQISPLLGIAAEAIESLQGEIVGIEKKFHWIVGAMAAQLSLPTDPPQNLEEYPAYVEWMKARMGVFAHYPESQFVELLGQFLEGNQKLKHLFNIEFGDDGVVAMPNKANGGSQAADEKGAEAAPLPPARFPVSTCVSDFAKRLGGKHEGLGS